MRKIFTSAICGLMWLGSLNMQAQQIAGHFDEQVVWGPETAFGSSFSGIGIEPKGWDALNVTQMGMNFPLVFGSEGWNGTGKGVQLTNRKLGALGIGANSPSYITLGKTWVYADIMGVMSQLLDDKTDPDDSDGGSTGGIDFTFRPDSIVGYYKRQHGTENPDEVAQIIVYSWIGSCTSYSPVGDGMEPTETLPKQPLTDRDTDILGNKNERTPANGITLISKQIHSIEGNIDEWTRISVPIDYLRPENPQKINVIITSADYFNRPVIGAENSLWVDEVRFIYNAKLKSLAVDGKEIPSFNEDTLTYTLPLADKNKSVTAVAYGKNAEVTIGETAGSQRTITVRDETAQGKKSYTYTIVYENAPSTITVTAPAAEKCIYGDSLDLSALFSSTDAETGLTYRTGNPAIASLSEGKLYFVGAGEVEISAMQGSASASLTLTVKRAPLLVKITDKVRSYSSAGSGNMKTDFVLTCEGLKNNDSKDNIYISQPVISVPAHTYPDGTVIDNYLYLYAGEYDVNISGGKTWNYEPIYQKGKLTVTPSTGKLKVTVSPDSISVAKGSEMPGFEIKYTGAVRRTQEYEDISFIFTTPPALNTTAVDMSQNGTYAVTLNEGVVKDYILASYAGIEYVGSKVTVLDPADFDNTVGEISGLPQEEYIYAGYTEDFLGQIIVKDTNGNPLGEDRISFSVQGEKSASAFQVINEGADFGKYRLWGNAIGEFDIVLTVKGTESQAPVSRTIRHLKITKKPALVKPADFTLEAVSFMGSGYIPEYAQSSDFYQTELEWTYTVCPTLKITTPEGIIELSTDREAEYDYTFVASQLEKVLSLTPGKYEFTIEGGESNFYDCTYDNSEKGTMWVPGKAVVVLGGVDGLTYGQDPFALTVTANGSAVTEYTVQGECVEQMENGKYKILSPGEFTVTFDIPAGEVTLPETGHVETVTIAKALLTVTPVDITCEEGKIIIPSGYNYTVTGYVHDDDESVITTPPTLLCYVTEDAKAGEIFPILAWGAASDLYDFRYEEGKFTVTDRGIGIDEHTALNMCAYIQGNNLHIKGNLKGETVCVYTLQGNLIGSYPGQENVIPVRLEKNSLYIVWIGSYVTKIRTK